MAEVCWLSVSEITDGPLGKQVGITLPWEASAPQMVGLQSRLTVIGGALAALLHQTLYVDVPTDRLPDLGVALQAWFTECWYRGGT